MNKQGGVGHQIPTDLRVENVQLKCIMPKPGSSISTEPPLSCLNCRYPQPSKRQTKSLSSWNRNVGSWPSLTAPEMPLCLPTLPLFKNKTKSPTPPSVLKHARHQGRTDGGGRTLPSSVKRACQKSSNDPARPGETGLPQDARRVLWGIYKNQIQIDICVGHKQKLLSPGRAPSPFRKSLCPKNLECWAKGLSPGSY